MSTVPVPQRRPINAAGGSFGERFLRATAVIIVAVIVPGLWPVVAFLRGQPALLADPIKFLLHHYGFVASVLLAVTLALTPVRLLSGGHPLALALNRHRRFLGVSAFFYALLHVCMHILYEGGLGTFWADVRRPFLVTGMVAFAILFALAATSFNRVIRALGNPRWKWLHRLAYIAAALVIFHQAAARKLFPMQVVWIFAPLALLQFGRVLRMFFSQGRGKTSRV